MPTWIEITKTVVDIGFTATVALLLLLGVSPKLYKLMIQNQKQYDIMKTMNKQLETLVTKLLEMLDKRMD